MKNKKVEFNNSKNAMSIALTSAVNNLSKKKQTEMIAKHIYAKYHVFKRFKPLAIGIDKDLIKELPHFDSKLILRVLALHCRKTKYLLSLSNGGKRFDLQNKIKGEVTEKEQESVKNHPIIKSIIEKNKATKENKDNTEIIKKTKEANQTNTEKKSNLDNNDKN